MSVASGISSELHPQRDASRVLTNGHPQLLAADIASTAGMSTILSATLKVGARGCVAVMASASCDNPAAFPVFFRITKVSNGGPPASVAGIELGTGAGNAAFNLALMLGLGSHEIRFEWAQPGAPGSAQIFTLAAPNSQHASLVAFELPTR
jgi:hypothetical protein